MDTEQEIIEACDRDGIDFDLDGFDYWYQDTTGKWHYVLV